MAPMIETDVVEHPEKVKPGDVMSGWDVSYLILAIEELFVVVLEVETSGCAFVRELTPSYSFLHNWDLSYYSRK